GAGAPTGAAAGAGAPTGAVAGAGVLVGAMAGEGAPVGAAAGGGDCRPATGPASWPETTLTMKPPFAPPGTVVVLVRVSVPVPLSKPCRNRPVPPWIVYLKGSAPIEPSWAGIVSETSARALPLPPGRVSVSTPEAVPAWERSSRSVTSPVTRTAP